MSKIKKIVERIKAERNKAPRSFVRIEFRKIQEQFLSLDRAIRNAIEKAYGTKNWVRDFSNKEIVFHSDSQPEGDYHKISYKIVKGEVSLVGATELVKMAVNYEHQMTADQLIQLASLESNLKEQRGRIFERRRK